MPRLLKGDYEIEKWTRLSAEVNGRQVQACAVSEIFVGASERIAMSRYKMDLDGKSEEHKDSGLIIATGTGSTGWYKAVLGCQHQTFGSFPKTKKIAKFVSAETFHNKFYEQKLVMGDLDFPQDSLPFEDSVSCQRLGFSFPRPHAI